MKRVYQWVRRNGCWVRVAVLAGSVAVSAVTVQPAKAALVSTDFDGAVADAGVVGDGAQRTFYKVLPYGLVIGLVLMGWRLTKKTAK